MKSLEKLTLEAFRQRLEIRFRRERRMKRLKLIANIVLASAITGLIPFSIKTMMDQSVDTPMTGPGKVYLESPKNPD
jgi:hypothetical protein